MDSPHPRLDALRKHLRGVKPRLVQVLLAFGIGSSLTWWYKTAIIRWLLAPAQGHLSPTGLPTFTGISEVFEFSVKLAITGGILVASPVISLTIFWLIGPLLGSRLRRAIAIFLPSATVLFLGGVAFAYFVVLPLVLHFMLNFGDGVATPMIGLTEYMDLALTLLLWIGVVFEIPLAMYLLARFRIVSYDQMKRLQWPPYVPVASIFLAAIITSTLEFSIPIAITALYEVGLVAAWVAGPHPPLSRVIGRWMPWLAWLAATVLVALAVAGHLERGW